MIAVRVGRRGTDALYLEVMLVASSRWTEEQIAEALTIVATTSNNREAARRTGIPESTIRAWRKTQIAHPAQEEQRKEAAQKMVAMAEEVRQRAIEAASEKVAETITDRLSHLADRLYTLAEKAVGKIDVAISDPEELLPGKDLLPHDRDGAAWLRSLVGVLAQTVDKAQLLSGKPTARPEVTSRHEYDITQRIIADPEAVDLAENLLRRAAGGDAGPLRLDGE